MRTSARCAALFLAYLALTGCYSLRVTRSESASFHPPINRDDVRIYRAKADAPPAYEIIGEIHLEGDSEFLKDGVQDAYFRKAAAELGANGVILLYGPQLGGAALLVSKMVPGLVRRESSALAIYVKEPPQ